MKHTTVKAIAIAIGLMTSPAIVSNSFAQEKTVMVGGAPMYPSKNIVENAVNSKDHTTLVAAVKAAGLVETLQSAGPFTVFAPVSYTHLDVYKRQAVSRAADGYSRARILVG